MLKTYILFIGILLSVGCITDKKSGNNTLANSIVVENLIENINFNPGKRFAKGTICEISVKANANNTPDSIAIFCNNKSIGTIIANNVIKYKATNVVMGNNSIIAQSYKNGAKQNALSTDIYIVSDIEPTAYTYKIINTYVHDKGSYTQGLIYENDYFYESGGQYGESSLRMVNVKTGKVEKQINLSSTVFAEGLAQYNNKLYQLSWREQTLFVYEKNSFKLTEKINYPIAEGWGLTFDGSNFLMTDGSNAIYIMEPNSFTQTGRVEVCDNNGPVKLLNELEYVNGLVYANLYTTNKVAIINAKTGEVVGMIDFKGILKNEDYHPSIDVLNGIAYNEANHHFYITGKYWPKMFEVEIVKNK